LARPAPHDYLGLEYGYAIIFALFSSDINQVRVSLVRIMKKTEIYPLFYKKNNNEEYVGYHYNFLRFIDFTPP
jgi:predicted SPOUT superfamily RNA methylase MTH1